LALVPDDNSGAVPTVISGAPAILDQISRLLAVTVCQHCGQSPYHGGTPGRVATGLDDVGPAEERLWRQLNEAAKVRASAPKEPPKDAVEAADKALTQARHAEQALRQQIEDATDALGDRRAWLRPNQRMALAGQLAEDRNALEPIRAQVAQEEKRVRELRLQRDRRQAYLTRYRRVLDGGRRAQAELDERIDALVHAYASLPVPPPWFALGLGYPPRPGEYGTWLRRARAVVAYRRRYGIGHPLEPLGSAVPEKGTPRYDHWRAAQP